MKEIKLHSKCPKCGNVNNVSESETKMYIHCQCCYHHYDFKINDIKSRITKDSNGVSSYLGVYIDEMDWLVEQAEKVEPLIKIALWNIIAMIHNKDNRYKALVELKEVVGNNTKFSSFIEETINELKEKEKNEQPSNCSKNKKK